MPNLASVIQQPTSAEPPDQQGASGTAPTQIPMQGQGAPQMAPPTHHETVAVLQHISAFDRGWRQILNNPEIGKANVRPQIYEFFTDMMNEGYVTLPQVMEQVKTMPTEPLEQKQWIEQHIENDQKAMAAVIEHYAQSAGPIGDAGTAMATLQENGGDRAQLVNGLVGRYKAHPKKPHNVKGIPIRG